MKFPKGYKLIILLNYLPFIFIVAGGFGIYFFKYKILFALFWVYLVPPLLTRLTLLLLGRPTSKTPALSRGFFAWWISLQLQIIFIRLPVLEELIRLVPGLYSVWLRLWGARIGKFVYWSAGLRIMDRPFLDIGDFAVIGYSAGFTAHHFQIHSDGHVEFVFGINKVGNYSVLGGESGLGPGAEVGEKETLPSYITLSPHFTWRGGRKNRSPAEEIQL